jgi:hypothetical protein
VTWKDLSDLKTDTKWRGRVGDTAVIDTTRQRHALRRLRRVRCRVRLRARGPTWRCVSELTRLWSIVLAPYDVAATDGAPDYVNITWKIHRPHVRYEIYRDSLLIKSVEAGSAVPRHGRTAGDLLHGRPR